VPQSAGALSECSIRNDENKKLIAKSEVEQEARPEFFVSSIDFAPVCFSCSALIAFSIALMNSSESKVIQSTMSENLDLESILKLSSLNVINLDSLEIVPLISSFLFEPIPTFLPVFIFLKND
jgi:hypothetical protein